MIEGQVIKIEEHKKTIQNQTKKISSQAARFLQIEAHMKRLELAISSNKEVADTQNDKLKGEVNLQNIKISKLSEENEVAVAQSNRLEEKVSRQKVKISEMGKEHYTIKTALESHIKGYKDTILVLTLRIETQEEEIQDIKLYSFGEVSILHLLS